MTASEMTRPTTTMSSPSSSSSRNSKWSTLANVYKLGRIPFTFEAPIWALLGSLLFRSSHDAFSTRTAILSATLVFLTNVSVNYANEYFDFEADSLTAKRAESSGSHGGSKILVDGILPRWSALAVAVAIQASILLCIVVSRAYAGDASSHRGFVLTFVLACMGMAQQYVGPPLRFHYRGGGELISSMEISSGPILYGFLTQYTTTRRHALSFDEAMSILSPSLRLFLVWAFLHELARIFIMHVADIREDIAARKYTLVSLVGYRKSKVLYVGTQLLAAFLALNLVVACPRAAWLMVPVYLLKTPINLKIERRIRDLVNGHMQGFESMSLLASIEVLVSALLLVLLTLIFGDCLH